MFDLRTALKNVWRDALLLGIPKREKYLVSLHPSIPTACWRWTNDPRPGEHKIFIGEKAMLQANKKDADVVYVQSLLFHELAHSLWTDKDIDSIASWCRDNDAPFELFNLFEDARIEAFFRRRYNRKFRWSEYEKPLKKAQLTPQRVLFRLIQSERVGVSFHKDITYAAKVKDYFRRIIRCYYTADLKPILLDWIKEFPPAKEPPAMSDIIQTDADAETMQGDSEEMEVFEGSGVPFPAPANSYTISDLSRGSIVWNAGIGAITQGYERYIPVIAKIFQDRKGYRSSESPSKRLNTRALSGLSDKLYRKKTLVKQARRTVNLIIDCSGSMSGTPIMNARALAMILNRLVQQGKAEGHLILTSAYRRSGVTETLKLPVAEEVIKGIPANGEAENISGTIQLTKPVLRKADYNFFFTDGNITDEPLDKASLRREGIYTYGLYIGKESDARLEQWFDRSITRGSLESLINELLRRIK